MQRNHDELLARLGTHQRATVLRPALQSALAISERVTTRRSQMASSGRYTEAGTTIAMRDEMPANLRAMQVAKAPVAKLKREIAAKREALRPANPDKSDLSGAIERGEIRQHFRSLAPAERAQLALSTTDKRLLDALVTAPPELSGFVGNQRDLIDTVEQRYVEMLHPSEVAELAALDELAAVADDIVAVARNGLRDVAGMEAREFEREAAKIEAAVWLVGNAGAEQVCEPDANGQATYRPATPDEVVTGRHYANAAEFMAARAA